MESHFTHCGQSPNGAVGHVTDAPQRFENRSMNVANEGSETRPPVHVLQHHNARRRHFENAFPPVRAVMETPSLHGRLTTAQTSRCGVTYHRRKVFKHASNARIRKSGISHPYLESFNRIRHRAGIKTLELCQLGRS